MGKLRVLSGRDVCRILERHGFREVRRRGSHVVMQGRTNTGTVTVPIPDHLELAIGTFSRLFGRAASYALNLSPDVTRENCSFSVLASARNSQQPDRQLDRLEEFPGFCVPLP